MLRNLGIMKKTVIFAVMLNVFVISSCNYGKHNQEQLHLDSLRQDSIKKASAITDSLSLIAWGDAKFGMSEEEVSATKAFKGGYFGYVSRDEVWSLKRVYGLEVLEEIHAEFQEDELYKVFLKSSRVSIRDFKYLENDCAVLTNVFTEKYGKPTFKKDVVSPGELFNDSKEIAVFNIGSKKITIWMSEYEYKYGYRVLIYNSSFPRKKHEPTEEEIMEQKERESKNKETLENSF